MKESPVKIDNLLEPLISDVRGMAAVIAHRTCARWMRRQFPERHALKNRLHYLITRQVEFHVYAKGVQVYQWNATTMFWDFVEPRAALFAVESYHGEIGTHFRGPNWQSKGGSRVKAAAVPGNPALLIRAR